MHRKNKKDSIWIHIFYSNWPNFSNTSLHWIWCFSGTVVKRQTQPVYWKNV